MVSDAECEEKALAWSKLMDGSISFSLDEEKEVSLGIIVNLTGQSSFGINAFKLEGITIEPLIPTRMEEIKDLHLSIHDEEGAVYNLAGQMVNGKRSKGKLPPKGIYIKGGTKLLVK